MRLKFALRTQGQEDEGGESRDLVATIDSSTTVGDLATYLAQADPERPALDPDRAPDAADPPDVLGAAGAAGGGGLTLAVVDQNHRVMDARLTVSESGLRSGVTVAVTGRVTSVTDVGAPVAVALIVSRVRS